MKIILDTNILFIPIKDKFDIFNELKHAYSDVELIILKDSLMELEKLHIKGIKYAKMAKENVLKQKIKKINIVGNEDVDTKIINTAKKQNAFIATIDKNLRKRAKQEGITCLAYQKSKKKFVVT